MKPRNLFLIAAIILATGIAGFYLKNQASSHALAASEKATPGKTLYQCPMHHQIIRDQPGQCPICGMDLRPMEKIKVGSGNVSERAPVAISPQRRQLIGVTYGEAKMRSLTRNIRAPGRIAYDPQLYQAVAEYRQALEALTSIKKNSKNSESNWARSMEKAAAFKLKLLGLSPSQIASWSKDPSLAQGLLVGKRGQAVWVYADVYEYDIQFIHPGIAMTIQSQTLPGKIWTTHVLSIDPVINPITRTARVRAGLDDVLGLLKPGTYVDVSIQSPLGSHLSVPESAVLNTGEKQYVFVASKDGTLEPRSILMGTKAGGYYEILSGLSPGETVSTSANFLIDAESQFQSAIESFAKPEDKDKGDGSSNSMGAMPGMKM
jgi:Cu(I)/Ag(I) efflux system membrane fusion protein